MLQHDDPSLHRRKDDNSAVRYIVFWPIVITIVSALISAGMVKQALSDNEKRHDIYNSCVADVAGLKAQMGMLISMQKEAGADIKRLLLLARGVDDGG